MNRRSFFWFLPAPLAAIFVKPAQAEKVAEQVIKEVSVAPELGEFIDVTNLGHHGDIRGKVIEVIEAPGPAEFDRLFRQSEQRMQSIADRLRRGGAYSKAIRG